MENGKNTPTPSPGALHTRWNPRLVMQIVALLLPNIVADTVMVAPLLVLPQVLDHFDTTQTAWISSGAMLAGAMWAPLFGKSADIHGKRRMLTVALLIACVGSLVCVTASELWVFVLGRMLQGAAIAAIFLTVAIVRELCAPRIAMPAVGAVATGAGFLGVGLTVLIEALAGRFGFQAVFAASFLLTMVAVACIRGVVPDPGFRTPGRVDVAGALLLGGGLTAVLGYISLGSELGWFSAVTLTLLGTGAAMLARWFLVSSRVPEPVIDIRNLGRPLLLTLLVVVLGSGAVQSMDQLLSLIAQVTPDRGLGYGLDAAGSLSLLFGVPAVGIIIGGLISGWIAARFDPSVSLAGGVLLGVVGATGMFVGATSFPAAICFAVLLNTSMGALTASGFNMAGELTPPERQGVVAGMVTVTSAIGSVGMSFVGAAVLSSTTVVVDGATMNSATGVFGYITVSVGVFLVATVPACLLLAHRRRAIRDLGAPPVADPTGPVDR
ncbi:MFS transporter [Nocardiopsis sp. NPDC101807]|uniref:MFS transporter n=1 Tax=Nocardiopsis sp. NPDC101807 TaxID=3364339 RepID=UPI003828DC6B